MKNTLLLRLLVGMYPREWRVRYGDEFMAMLEQYTPTPRDIGDILMSVFEERYLQKGMLFRRWIPGLAALAMLLIMLAGLATPDENLSENLMIIVVMTPIVFLVPVLHHLLRQYAPRWSYIARNIGYTGTVGTILAILLTQIFIPEPNLLLDLLLMIFFLVMLNCVIVWMIIVNCLGVYTRRLPIITSLTGLIAALSWVTMMTIDMWFAVTGQTVSYSELNNLHIILSVVVMAWIGGFILWSFSLTWYFFSGHVYHKLKIST